MVDSHGRVLVLQRSPDSTDAGQWCLPGGKVDYGDTVEQAAVRELREETGLRATSLEFLFYQDSLPRAPGKMHCINIYFRCKTEGEITLNEESTDVTWIGPDDIHRIPLSFRNDEALIKFWRINRTISTSPGG